MMSILASISASTNGELRLKFVQHPVVVQVDQSVGVGKG